MMARMQRIGAILPGIRHSTIPAGGPGYSGFRMQPGLPPGSTAAGACHAFTDARPMSRAPLVLMAGEHEWETRSLGSVLTPHGYAILHAYSGAQALQKAGDVDPDAVLIGSTLPDMDAVHLCRTLREKNLVSVDAPILLIMSPHVTRADRLRALEAGAWDVVHLPTDAEEFLLRTERLIQGRLAAEHAPTHALIDEATGLYSWEGLIQRVREIGAAADRFRRPLACIVIGAEPDPDTHDPETRSPVELADRLRRSIRQSDILGRIGASEFAVVAPDTPPEGARVLADRIRRGHEHATDAPGLRAGVYAVPDLHEARLDPIELMLRATTASRASLKN